MVQNINLLFGTKLGSVISLIRKELNFTQVKLADKSGITQGYLSKIEKGEQIPTVENLQKLSKGLSIPTHMLLYLAESKNRAKKGKVFELIDENLQTLFSFYIALAKEENEDCLEKNFYSQVAEIQEDLKSIRENDIASIRKEFQASIKEEPSAIN